MSSARWTAEECGWLRANYGLSDIHETTRLLNGRFGTHRTEHAVYTKANVLGLHRPLMGGRRRAERAVRWSAEPEMEAFMLEHDTGSIPAAIGKFEARFGFRLTPQQVSTFRSRKGRQIRRGNDRSHDWNRRPVGYERDSGKGYMLVKVRERARVPGSKDNWALRGYVEYERAYGPVPEGCEIVHCDRDGMNDDPANLMAVPKALVGIINQKGIPYGDRESLEAAVGIARLIARTRDMECRPRECAVCGRTFSPQRATPGTRTCPECVAAGRKAKGRRSAGKAACERCGKVYERYTRRQRLCHECSVRTHGNGDRRRKNDD